MPHTGNPRPDGDDRHSLERAIAGALRAAIHDHGPITPDKIGSAVKRVIGNLANARVNGVTFSPRRDASGSPTALT